MEQTSNTLAKNARSNQPPTEGGFTKKVELFTAKLPSVTWLGLAIGSMVLSAGIATVNEKKGLANFVGMWAPSLLLIGIYNKLVKMENSNKVSQSSLH